MVDRVFSTWKITWKWSKIAIFEGVFKYKTASSSNEQRRSGLKFLQYIAKGYGHIVWGPHFKPIHKLFFYLTLKWKKLLYFTYFGEKLLNRQKKFFFENWHFGVFEQTKIYYPIKSYVVLIITCKYALNVRKMTFL